MDEKILSLLAASASYWIYSPSDRSLPFWLQLGSLKLEISRSEAWALKSMPRLSRSGHPGAHQRGRHAEGDLCGHLSGLCHTLWPTAGLDLDQEPTSNEQRRVFVLSFRGTKTPGGWAANAAVVPDKQKRPGFLQSF